MMHHVPRTVAYGAYRGRPVCEIGLASALPVVLGLWWSPCGALQRRLTQDGLQADGPRQFANWVSPVDYLALPRWVKRLDPAGCALKLAKLCGEATGAVGGCSLSRLNAWSDSLGDFLHFLEEHLGSLNRLRFGDDQRLRG